MRSALSGASRRRELTQHLAVDERELLAVDLASGAIVGRAPEGTDLLMDDLGEVSWGDDAVLLSEFFVIGRPLFLCRPRQRRAFGEACHDAIEELKALRLAASTQALGGLRLGIDDDVEGLDKGTRVEGSVDVMRAYTLGVLAVQDTKVIDGEPAVRWQGRRVEIDAPQKGR